MTGVREDRPQAYDVVVVGGGNAGISLAAFLRSQDARRTIAVVAPEDTHVYRPLLSYVGAGMAHPDRPTRPQSSLIPRGCDWIRDAVTRVVPRASGTSGTTGAATPADAASDPRTRVDADPDHHTVVTAGGEVIGAVDLVLCPGTVVDWDAIPGSREACRSAYGSTNYTAELAPHTWAVLRDLRRGRALFLVSNRNTPCPGVGLKPLFLAADHWRRTGCLDDIDITLVLEDAQPFGLDRADDRLRDELRRLGVRLHTSARIESIDPDDRLARIAVAGGGHLDLPYDAMHLAPPHRGHAWLVESGLTDPDTTLVANDPRTLEHRDHPGLWALGDAATLETPSSGGGLRPQVPVLSHNILARRSGATFLHYDGYTVAPIPLDRRRLMLAERLRDGHEYRTFSAFSLARPLRALMFFDLVVQPPVYWHRLLRGKGLDPHEDTEPAGRSL